MNLHDRDIKKAAREEGIAIGTQQGEQKKAIETATNMLKKKYPASEISEITGLPLEQILELQKQTK